MGAVVLIVYISVAILKQQNLNYKKAFCPPWTKSPYYFPHTMVGQADFCPSRALKISIISYSPSKVPNELCNIPLMFKKSIFIYYHSYWVCFLLLHKRWMYSILFWQILEDLQSWKQGLPYSNCILKSSTVNCNPCQSKCS